MKHIILISLTCGASQAFAQTVNDSIVASSGASSEEGHIVMPTGAIETGTDSLSVTKNKKMFRRKKRKTKEQITTTKDSTTVKAKEELNSKKEDTSQQLTDKKDSLKSNISENIPNGDSMKNAIISKVPFNNDSIGSNIKDQVAMKKDSLSGLAKDQLAVKKNQLGSRLKGIIPMGAIKRPVKSLALEGSISVGYEYGVLPSVMDGDFPLGGMKTEGNISFSAMTLPFDLTFHYTNIKNSVGLNNYFRLSFNSAKYKEQLIHKLNFKNSLNINQLGKLELQQQKLTKKLEYLKFLQQNPNYKLPSTELLNKYNDIDTSAAGKMKQRAIDSLKGSMSAQEWLAKKDSIRGLYLDNKGRYDAAKKAVAKSATDTAQHYLQKKDTVMNEYNTWKARYDSINNQINEVKTRIEQIRDLLKDPASFAGPYLSRGEQFLSHIKKFEIGLCNPSYSTFLVSNIPLQGVNMEYVKNNNFFGLSYGTTVNNLLYNTNTLQGVMQGVRNLYNYFDFGNLSAGRKVLSLKGGFGTPETTHFLVGALVGKGRTDYLYVLPESTSPYSKESNLVFELDARYKFSKQLSVDFIVGKSSVKDGSLNDQFSNNVNEVFSNYRSYAILGRINGSLVKTGTNLTFTTRWIDPYFKSFGVGFLRSDNLRFEMKAEQPFSKRVKYTVVYRRDTDNLLNLHTYKNTLQSINNTVSMKLSREFSVRLNYAPLFRELKGPETTIRDRNHIMGVVVSYTPRPKKMIAQFNVLYCKNIITADSANVNFENFTYSQQLQFKSRISTGLNVSWLKNNLTDTLNNDTYIGMLDIGYSTKKRSRFSVGGKMAYKKGIDIQYGFIAKASIHIYKGLFWETEAEKIIIGDYYNSIIIDKINRFPYYCTSKFILNF